MTFKVPEKSNSETANAGLNVPECNAAKTWLGESVIFKMASVMALTVVLVCKMKL